MAVVVVNEVPGLTQDVDDAVGREIDAANNPPEGGIVHSGGPIEGGWRVIDVWESAEHFQRFREERLGPAIAKVMGETGGAPPEPNVTV